MTTSRDPDRLLRAWLDLMPDEAPDRVIASVVQAVVATPQWRSPIDSAVRRFFPMSRLTYAAVAIAIAVLGGGAVLLVSGKLGPDQLTPSRPPTEPPRAILTDGPALPAIPAATVGMRNGGILEFMYGPKGGLTAAVLDPKAASWRTLQPDPLPFAAVDGEPLLLDDGRVFLLTRKVDVAPGGVPAAVIFDPASEQFSTAMPANEARSTGRAVLLPDGRVLVAGGDSTADEIPQRSMEVFDPNLEQWSAAGSLDLSGALGLGPVLLADGRLIATSYQFSSDGPVDVLIVDPSSGSTTRTLLRKPTQTDAASFEVVAAEPLASGRVLFFGSPNDAGNSEVFSWVPGEPSVTPIATLPGSFQVLALQDGRFLAMQGALGGATLWNASTGSAETVGPFASTFPWAALLPDGRVILVGGYVRGAPIGPSGTPPASKTIQFLQFK